MSCLLLDLVRQMETDELPKVFLTFSPFVCAGGHQLCQEDAGRLRAARRGPRPARCAQHARGFDLLAAVGVGAPVHLRRRDRLPQGATGRQRGVPRLAQPAATWTLRSSWPRSSDGCSSGVEKGTGSSLGIGQYCPMPRLDPIFLTAARLALDFSLGRVNGGSCVDLESIPRRLSLLRSWSGDSPARGFSVTLEVAFRCNVRCVFCSRWSDPTDLETRRPSRAWPRTWPRSTPSYVSLTGGDPFVRRDIREIIDAFARNDPSRSTSTPTGWCWHKLRRLPGVSRAKRRSAASPYRSTRRTPRCTTRSAGSRARSRRALAGMDRHPPRHPGLAGLHAEPEEHARDRGVRAVRRGAGLPLPLPAAARRRRTTSWRPIRTASRSRPQTPWPASPSGWRRSPTPERSFELQSVLPTCSSRSSATASSLDSLRCTTAARLIYFVDPQGDVYPCDTRRDVKLGNVYQTRLAEIVRGRLFDRAGARPAARERTAAGACIACARRRTT